MITDIVFMSKLFIPLPKKFEINLIYRDIILITLDSQNYFEVAGVSKKFNSMSAAHEALYEAFPDTLPGFEVEEIVAKLPDKYSGGHSSLISKEDNRMFFSYSKESREKLWNLDSEYRFFLKNAYRPYKKNPKDFFNSYRFLASHPLFWSLKGDINKSGVLYWETDEGLEDAWHTIFKNPKGKVVHLLEIGPYLEEPEKFKNSELVLPNRIPSHDINLDTYGPTYEKAIIKLAKKVEKLYLPNGEIKPSAT